MPADRFDGTEPKYKLPIRIQKEPSAVQSLGALEEDSTGAVVLVEGFFDCMKVTQAEHVCVALMGCSLSKEQEAQTVAHSARSSSCSMAMKRGAMPEWR